MNWPDTAEDLCFDELEVGQRFTGAPGIALTQGPAAAQQAIVGDRLRLPLAHPALVWDTAIGQSIVVTHHVRANLFYRGLAFRRYPALGDTLRTVTGVVGLREDTRRPGRMQSGWPLSGLPQLTSTSGRLDRCESRIGRWDTETTCPGWAPFQLLPRRLTVGHSTVSVRGSLASTSRT